MAVFAAAMTVAAAARSVAWPDLPATVQSRLERAGITRPLFPAKLAALDSESRERVRDGDYDHLVFYMLQSRHFTKLPPIEPALSSGAPVEARTEAFLDAIASADPDPRLAYFRSLLHGATTRAERRALIDARYARVMSFLRRKEFDAAPTGGVERLYETRGLSTDTEIEAGYAVQVGLGVLKGLEPSRRIRHVLIVGPGMDLAPRTGMLEAGPPESYQPWAVIDALVGLGLSTLDGLDVVAADINPRVVDHLRASASSPPVLQLVSGIGESGTVAFSAGFQEYFAALGESVGGVSQAKGGVPAGHVAKVVTVRPNVARTLHGESLNVVTERLTGRPFDLIVATNILPYFDHVERLLALSNIAGMLAPGGVFLHNDARQEVLEDAAAADLAAEQSRQVIIATVKGAPPLVDTIVLHRRQ